MIFESIEIKGILEVLQILSKKKSKYSIMFKETKISHTTLQKVLKNLENKKFIKRHDIGHMKVDYEISEKGRNLLEILLQLKDTLK